ncbi:MAG TPA: hypothetical protein H9688_06810 [Firmicutes bacterium]|nr:hypothetical protein [Bacillota bacterium]
MSKPASMAIREFEEKLEESINNSGLPPVIVEMVLRGYYIQIKEMAKRQADEEEAAFKSEVRDNGE